MKKSIIKWTVVVSAILLTAIFLATAQKNKNLDSTGLEGGWIVCVDTLFNKDYVCEQPYTAFDFNKDGTYIEFRQSANPEQPESIQKFEGKWKLDKNALGLKENDTPGKVSIGVIYKINWLDKDHFYSESSEGELARKMYRYFSRKN